MTRVPPPRDSLRPLEDATRTSDKGAHSGRAGELVDLAFAVIHAGDGHRIGDVVFGPREGTGIFGRGTSERHLSPVRQRPGSTTERPPFDSPFLSREQLRITRTGTRALHVENTGKCPLFDGEGNEVRALDVAPGDALALGEDFALVCVERPRTLPALHSSTATDVDFGEADAQGLVGESPEAWALRDTLAFVAARSAHVLVLGPSGSGKELAARAIHRLSARRARPMVARNASTLPSGLIEAELFGTAANYPAHGMPERHGLVGEADGGTLFLDEIGELSEELSTRLLRVLDEQGDYQRLGDTRRRSADVRVVAATNQPVAKLRADVAARFKLRITLPGLASRREDIPLLVRHLATRIAVEDVEVSRRFFHERGADRQGLRITAELLVRLVTHPYATHVRELDRLLWLSLGSSKDGVLAYTPEVAAEMFGSAQTPPGSMLAKGAPSREAVVLALARAGGVHERAWQDLGLASRHVLKRLVKKYGITR